MIRALFLVLLLAGCGPAGNTPDAICERDANDDPAVKFIIMRQAGTPALRSDDSGALALARANAKRACLRRLGMMPAGSGGVEPVRQPNSSFRGLQ
ncbi:MAG: hypothetical protein EXR05_02040 [Acetobacteraceae bacterium]|nr:hypothetical protein [Acetobacteraceae bacterium]MSP30857.1 hypothetical protein [Acetobacteraceae bacterium]